MGLTSSLPKKPYPLESNSRMRMRSFGSNGLLSGENARLGLLIIANVEKESEFHPLRCTGSVGTNSRQRQRSFLKLGPTGERTLDAINSQLSEVTDC